VKGEIVIENNMKIFKTAQINAWEFAPIKISLLCVGIAIGANWPELFDRLCFSDFSIWAGARHLCGDCVAEKINLFVS